MRRGPTGEQRGLTWGKGSLAGQTAQVDLAQPHSPLTGQPPSPGSSHSKKSSAPEKSSPFDPRWMSNRLPLPEETESLKCRGLASETSSVSGNEGSIA